MELSVKEQAVLYEAFKKDPLFFGRTVFPQVFYTKESPSFHKVIVDNIVDPKEKITVLAVARGRAKSTISTFLMPIYLAIFRGYKYICISSLAGKRANEFLERIKDYITDQNISEFPKLFGDVRGNKWSATQIDLVYKNSELGIDVDCRIDSLGSGMQFAGAVRRATRPELIILDDIEDDETVANEDIVNKYMTKLYDVIIPSLDKRRGHIIIIGTPYGHDSMLKRMYYTEHGVHKIKLPALVETDDQSAMLNVPIGKSIWENQFSTKEVIDERDEWSANNKLDSWNAQKMCHFNAQVGFHRFYETDIHMYEPKDVDTTSMNLYMLIDAAYKKKKTNDPAGIVLIGVDINKNYYVLEAIEGRWGGFGGINQEDGDKNYDVMLARVAIDMAKRYIDTHHKVKAIGIESYAYDFLTPSFYREMERQGCFIPLRELEPKNRGKEDRIAALTPVCNWGKIFLQRRHTMLKNQMLKFDAMQKQTGLHMLDAFAYILDIGVASGEDKGSGPGSKKNAELFKQIVYDPIKARWDNGYSDRDLRLKRLRSYV